MSGLFSLSPLFCETLFGANAPFPRGPGFYYHPAKLVAVLVVYFCWVKTCWWVDQDAQRVRLPRKKWNPILLGCGALGFLALWASPDFGFAFGFLLILYVGSAVAYVDRRNRKVPDDEKVLTADHFRRLMHDWLKVKAKKEEKPAGPKPIPLRFISKSSQGQEDPTRVARAMGSKGYQAALAMVHAALLQRATDIHMEPSKEEMSIRYRIDGILQAAPPMERGAGDGVVNIFKVLGDLDITEKRKPQDGSFSAVADGEKQIDFRVATAGSVAGEKLVMRILDRSGKIADLAGLGMRPAMNEKVRELVTLPHGLFVVCGPTGSGKSTTLYACLSEIDRFQKNVITVENPVEYHIPNVTQIEVNPKAGKTFASELRSILRQDPDVIYIGEIRDQETAEIACQAAQTGHMVFTTLHANDTSTAIARLIDLGVQPFLVASALTAVLGQRLVRVLCPKCKMKYRPNPDVLRKANFPADQIKFFYRPLERTKSIEFEEDGEPIEEAAGNVCPQCGGHGYRGRTGVFELMVVTDKIRELIRGELNLSAIRQEALKGGMKPIQEDALRQVIGGATSIQELLRVCK